MLQPVVRRTWAPRGCPPVHRLWERRERLSAIAALSLAPRRRRCTAYFQLENRNIHSGHVERFLTQVHHHLRRPCVLVLDRFSVHRKAVRELLIRHPDWFRVEWLPAYAPELNPVEYFWNAIKYAELANFLPEDVFHLQHEVTQAMDRTRGDPERLCCCFHQAGLDL
jgi:transposase